MVYGMEQLTLHPKTARENSALNEETAAAAIGCSVRSLQRYEAAERRPDAPTLVRMGVVYDLDHREFRRMCRWFPVKS